MSSALHSWGCYPPHPQTPRPVQWRSELAEGLRRQLADHGSTLAFGNGRSYGDSCMAASDHVLHMRPLARFIETDWASGRLIAEAGTTLGEVLALAVPRGWFLPVSPGTQFVTLGGAIANDVHGKNHHVRGTFGRHVLRFSLHRSDCEPVVCSPAENAELFGATVGGLGLTGIVEWAEIQLMPIRSAFMDQWTVRFGALDEFFALSREFDASHEYTVAWIDCVARGSASGRGVYAAANHADEGGLQAPARKSVAMPLRPKASLINHWSLRLFNETYFRLHSRQRQRSAPSYASYFYPLDRVLNWNRAYGRRGFQQYQCVIPEGVGEAAMREILAAIRAEDTGSFLAVLKKCGASASPGWLSFPLPGVSLALDFPQQDERNGRLFARLDAIVREAGGRLYAAKDAHMSGDDFRRFYPLWPRLEAVRDPALCSRLWKRVLTP